MRTKATIITLLFLFILPIGLYAQPGRGKADDSRLESFRIAFITRKLSLSPDESKKFWPVYDKYQEELKVLREGQREQRRNLRQEFDDMNDKDIEKFIDSEIQMRQSELDILKKYNSQFKAILPIRKVALLYKAEEDFKRELLQRLQDRQMPPGRR